MQMEQPNGCDRTPTKPIDTRELDFGLSDFKFIQGQMQPNSTDLKLAAIELVDNTSSECSAIRQNAKTPAKSAKNAENVIE